MQEYIKRAVATENKDYEGIGNRLESGMDEVFPALNKAILALQELDHIVKKKTMYGKPPKFYEAPLFSRSGGTLSATEKHDILKSEAFIRLLHGFIGIATESGEGLEALANYLQTGELDKVNVAEELGDCFWYQALIADTCGSTFETEQEKNIQKLAHRHGKKFSTTKVMDRDLEGERAILN